MSSAPLLAALGPVEQLRAGRLARRLPQLLLGLTLYGVSMALMIRSGLGQLPWDVLHYGLALHVPLSIGVVVIVTSLLVLLLWIPLRQAPGVGTLLNATLIGVALDLSLASFASPGSWPARIGLMLGGIVLNGLATALYIGAQLGPGPRDGLMTGWARRSGRSMRAVRTALEVVVVALGWALGGVVGIGTVLYALAIGPLTQHLLPAFVVSLPSGPVDRPAGLSAGSR